MSGEIFKRIVAVIQWPLRILTALEKIGKHMSQLSDIAAAQQASVASISTSLTTIATAVTALQAGQTNPADVAALVTVQTNLAAAAKQATDLVASLPATAPAPAP